MLMFGSRSRSLPRAVATFLVALFALTVARAQSVRWEIADQGMMSAAIQLVFENCTPDGDPNLPTIPGVTYNGLITTRYFLDFGPDLDDGIISNYPPSVAGRPAYPIFVSEVDKDGNEKAGVRLPPVEAPIATTTGWGLRRAGFSENEGCESNGQHIPLKTTKAERQAAGDPRRSLEERYKSHAGYVRDVAKAAKKLEREGFLLPADAQQYIDEAQASNVLR